MSSILELRKPREAGENKKKYLGKTHRSEKIYLKT